MHVLIMGAGAVGGCYGEMLAQAGHTVTLVARGEHLAALRERGLEVRHPDRTTHLHPVRAVADPGEVTEPVDLIFFTVKGYDTASAIEALRPVVGPETAVLPLQNGVDGVDDLAAAFGVEHVLAGTTTINGAVEAPGVIVERGVHIRTTIAELSGLVTPRLEAIADALRATGTEVVVGTDAAVALWTKFVLLAPHATITSAIGETVGTIRAIPEGADLYRRMIEEAVAVARGCGVALPADIAATTYAFAMGLAPAARSSMAIDFARGRRVELEQLTGALVRRGRAVGVPTPGFDTLYPVLKVRAVAGGLLTPG